jgi:sec-independent protein translocase protein TatC
MTDAPGDKADPAPDPDNPNDEDAAMEATRAPLIAHLQELRTRLIVVVISLAAAFVIGFLVSRPLFAVLAQPFADAAAGIENFRFIYTGPLEFFIVLLKIALYTAIALSFPMVAYQLYAFVAPGLYSTEKKAALPFLIASPFLFMIGASIVYFGVFPMLARFALSFQNDPIGSGAGAVAVEHLPRVSEYLSLGITLVAAFGLAFQLPVLIGLLAMAGLVSPKGLARGRKYAVLGTFVFAAVATPPDPFTQFALALPVYLLYEASIFVARLVRRRDEAETS